MKKLSEEEKNAFVERYKNYYFRTDPVDVDEKKKVLGDISLTGTEVDIEDDFFPGGKYRKFDQIGVKHILWKAGRLTPEMLNMPDEDLTPRNGQGREIENLDEFLRWINKINKDRLQKCLDDEDFKEAIKVLFECKLGSGLKQIGSVYVITILFFLSEGKYPIYDKYAHTAVKALYLNKNPKDVFVGEAPQITLKRKEEEDLSDEKFLRGLDLQLEKVLGMYQEYMELLEQVFGSSSIDRELDRSLWVYGHSRERFDY